MIPSKSASSLTVMTIEHCFGIVNRVWLVQSLKKKCESAWPLLKPPNLFRSRVAFEFSGTRPEALTQGTPPGTSGSGCTAGSSERRSGRGKVWEIKSLIDRLIAACEDHFLSRARALQKIFQPHLFQTRLANQDVLADLEVQAFPPGLPCWGSFSGRNCFRGKKASNPVLVIICAMSGNLADSSRRTTILFSGYDVCCLNDSFFAIVTKSSIIEGSLEVKLPTKWTDEKQRREEAERRERLEERRVEEKESEESRCRCEKR